MEIQGYFINTKNILYVTTEVRSTNGYRYEKNITLYIYFVGRDKPLSFVFYISEKDEYDAVMNKLKEVLL